MSALAFPEGSSGSERRQDQDDNRDQHARDDDDSEEALDSPGSAPPDAFKEGMWWKLGSPLGQNTKRYRFSQIKLQNWCCPQVVDIPILARRPCNYLGENLYQCRKETGS
jgi:hypothetical protein